MEKCKYCPHCKSNRAPTIVIMTPEKDFEGSYAVVCDYVRGGCGAQGGYRATVAEAVEAWDMRAEEQP